VVFTLWVKIFRSTRFLYFFTCLPAAATRFFSKAYANIKKSSNNGSITAIFHHFSSFHFLKKNRFQILEIVKRINSRILKISIGTGFSPFLFLENSIWL